mmetsp:Transcript_89349/g.144728  ORF Transcript_89349/g.144728 Transcript_89349/m.144728 type:complete len:95 (-) Transcript_89349:100-384(-)
MRGCPKTMQWVAVRCRVLLCVAVIAVCECVALRRRVCLEIVSCNRLQRVVKYCSALSVLQGCMCARVALSTTLRVAKCGRVLQSVAECCSESVT